MLKKSNNKIYLKKTITAEDGFIHITIAKGAYEIEALNEEVKRIINVEGHFTEADYPFQIKPYFSTLGSNVEISYQGPSISFFPNDSILDLLGLKPKVLQEEYSLSDYPVGIISFDRIFLECDVAQGMIFKGKRSGIIHNFSMDLDPGYKYIEKFRGGVQWYMKESKDIISNICFNKKMKIIN